MSVRRLESLKNLKDCNGKQRLPKVENAKTPELAELDLYLLKEYKQLQRGNVKTRSATEIPGLHVTEKAPLLNIKEIQPYKSPLPLPLPTASPSERNEQLATAVLLPAIVEREGHGRAAIQQSEDLALREVTLQAEYQVRNIISACWAELVISENQGRGKIHEAYSNEVRFLETAKDDLDTDVYMESGGGGGSNTVALQKTVASLRRKVVEMGQVLETVDAAENKKLENDLRMAHSTILELRAELRCKDLELRKLKTSQAHPPPPLPKAQGQSPPNDGDDADDVSSCESQDLNEHTFEVSTPRCVPSLSMKSKVKDDPVLSEQIMQECAVRQKKWLTKAASYDALIQYMVPGIEVPPLNGRSPFVDTTLEEQIIQENRSRSNRTLAKSESLFLLGQSCESSGGMSPPRSPTSSFPATPRGHKRPPPVVVKTQK